MEDDRPEDDPSIPNDEILYRRVQPEWIKDKKPSSAAFQNLRDNAFSVHLGSVLKATGREPRELVAGFPGYVLVKFTAGLARELDQGVVPDPKRDDPSHAHVVSAGKNKPGSVKKAFAKRCEVVPVPPPKAND